jgi:hypothetical protein
MEITANAVQTVNENQNVLFTDTVIKGSCSIVHRDGSGLVTLRGLTDQYRASFKVTFGGNIAIAEGGTVEPISLAISINGEPVATTTMTETPAATQEFNNVFSAIFINVPCGCCSQISVKNISTQPIDVQNANLIIERVA